MPKATGNWHDVTIAGHPCQYYEPIELSEHNQCVLYLHDLDLRRLQGNTSFEYQCDLHGLRLLAPQSGPTWWSSRICQEFDTTLSAEAYLLNCVMPQITQRWNCKPGQFALLGMGMGGQGALRIAYKHPNTFPVVAAIKPAIDYQIRIEEGDQTLARMYNDAEDARQDTATLHIHPLNWPRQQWFCGDPADYRWYDSVDRLRMKLHSLGVPFECDLQTSYMNRATENMNPSTDPSTMVHPEAKPVSPPSDYSDQMVAPAFSFLATALEHERLRV
jgi:hypothetical protein